MKNLIVVFLVLVFTSACDKTGQTPPQTQAHPQKVIKITTYMCDRERCWYTHSWKSNDEAWTQDDKTANWIEFTDVNGVYVQLKMSEVTCFETVVQLSIIPDIEK